MKKVLFAASESVPFIKTGGLADVVGSLPKAYNRDEFDVRVVLPKYRVIPEHFQQQMEYMTNFYINMAGRMIYVGVFQMMLDILSTMNTIFPETGFMKMDCGILRSLLTSVRPH